MVGPSSPAPVRKPEPAGAGAGVEHGRVLVVCGDDPLAAALAGVVSQAGASWEVRRAAAVDPALASGATAPPDVVVIVHPTPGVDAFDFLERRPDALRGVPVVVVAERGDEAGAVRLLKLGVRDYLDRGQGGLASLPVALRHVLQEERLARAARATEQRYRTLFEVAGDALFIHDRGGHFLDVNAAACRMLGLAREDLLRRRLSEIAAPRDSGTERPVDEVRAWLRDGLRRLDGAGRASFEASLARADGLPVPVEIVSTLQDVDGQPLVFSSARDISERLRNDAALRRATADWEQTFHAITDPLAVTDAAGRVIRANRAMLTRLGATLPELQDRSVYELVSPPDGAAAGEGEMTEPRSWDAEMPALGGNYQVTAFPRRDEDGLRNILFYCKDVTHERQLRARMLQTEKLSSLGQLVSGVAHELNNPLAAVQGLAELLLEDLEETGSGDVEDVRNILDQSQRASGIVRNLLQFSRRSHQKGEVYDLNGAVRAAVALLRYRLSSREITLDLNLDDGVPSLFGVIQHIEQVIVNLLLNAYEALSEDHSGGRIRVATRLGPDGFVELVVEDDGPGVPPEHVTRVFEPFFTTKEVGRGTGLGLSVSYGLLEEHGGDIHVDPCYRDGARFVVRLPVTTADAREDRAATGPADAGAGGGDVLVIEDEPELAEAMREALVARGVRAQALTSAAAALRRLDGTGTDLVVCAAGLTSNDGEPLHDLLLARFPALQGRLVLTTDASGHDDALAAAYPVLKKPFSTDRLYDWTIRHLRRARELGRRDGARHGR
jgi:PAS domain S-box-containing protein